jgi:hypothetical protein
MRKFGFFHDLFCDPEDGSETFHQDVVISPNYTTLSYRKPS